MGEVIAVNVVLRVDVRPCAWKCRKGGSRRAWEPRKEAYCRRETKDWQGPTRGDYAKVDTHIQGILCRCVPFLTSLHALTPSFALFSDESKFCRMRTAEHIGVFDFPPKENSTVRFAKTIKIGSINSHDFIVSPRTIRHKGAYALFSLRWEGADHCLPHQLHLPIKGEETVSGTVY